MTLPPVYTPAEVEQHWYSAWEAAGYFKPDTNAPEGPFTIVIPPPNITGILHMGHALNNTLQDILIRFKRMQGYAVLWVPGTDHAGIATQNVVERELLKQKITRQQLGREKFIERVWEWRAQYGSTIVKQLRRLGSSCDWSRERFTMDPAMSKAVETAFLQLYEKGLIYRGHYMVNWCPRCQTALSDEEVTHEEIKGHLWHIRYPLAEGGEGILVATTRPETMLGDVAVAVNPEDPRYQSLIGKNVILPLVNRSIPIIADKEVKSEFGTGAVKITPAHDPVDYEIARRHPDGVGLTVAGRFSIPPNLFVIAPDATMRNVPDQYRGLDRFECRKQVVENLGKLVEKTEDYKHSVGHCYRCKTVIEPHLSPQWFVRMKPLAELGIEAVERDGMRFIPDRWTKVYLDWLANIRDWCVSRQIWWGHRIPIWYHPECNRPDVQGYGKWVDGKYVEPGMVVGHHEEMKSGNPPPCPTCGQKTSLLQDSDVLDTWFSSWLWPFSTLGWPRQTKDLSTFYPTSVLVTGQDIIFFWVARMVMAGKLFMEKIPFKEVYIHGIIRVEGGKKMSKSLGNIIDPLEVINRMGADALRFSIAHMTSEGQDLYLSEGKFLLGRNFANKLWNAARLIGQSSGLAASSAADFDSATLSIPDRWILSRFAATCEQLTQALEGYRFNEAARLLYQFVWHEFCDWYLEITKVAKSTPGLAAYILEGTLRLLHPFMPFITEEIWQKIERTANSDQRLEKSTILRASWPKIDRKPDEKGERAFQAIQNLIVEIRNIRSSFRVPVKEEVSLLIQGRRGAELLREHEEIIKRLASVSGIRIEEKVKRPTGSVISHLATEGTLGPWDLIVPLAGLVDLSVERKRMKEEMADLSARAEAKRKRLSDPTFRAKAPGDVVAEEEELLKGLEAEIARWSESLKQLE